MEISPADSSLFRSAVEALKEFLPEAQIFVKATGVSICGMDRSHVGFVDYFLAAEDCETIKVGAPLTIGMNMVNFARVLANVGSGDKITLTMSKARDRLVVSYKNEKIGKKAVFELPLMEIHEDSLQLPALEFAAKVTARTSDVGGVVKEVGAFGDAMELKLNGGGFHISATGDMGSAKQTLENTDDRDMELTEDEVVASYGTKYLMAIMKSGAPLASTTTLEFDGSAQPLRASFHYGGSSHFIAYLAPKIND
jgi:proliferating cell nuclear antigen PCNA